MPLQSTIATVDGKGKRIWIYPRKPSGYYHRLRVVVTVLLLALLFAGPFIRIGGQPMLLLNIFARRFVIFGQAFWPQDFVVLALILLAFFVFIILFTVVFGRIWCGWMCPQTLFMEMVFRKIEYWIEGDANDQRRLNNEPWTLKKVGKKSFKQGIFLAISILIAHTSMAYLIGTDGVFGIIRHSPGENPTGFIGLAVFTMVFYFVFAYFREQVCVAICPYGRLQGVLLSKDSMVVAYDWLRGEPRGRLRKDEPKKSDCIDCKLCVHVCPTGIDIRNGTQLECINCTACMDACDDVMVKIDRPKGLIRYASYNSIQNGVQKIISGRVAGYAAILATLLGVVGFTLVTRADVETTALKIPGTLYQKGDNGQITNLYNVEFVNKTFGDLPLELEIIEPAYASLRKPDGNPVIVTAGSMLKVVYFIEIPGDEIKSAKTVVTIGVFNKGKQIEKVKVKFIGPVSPKVTSDKSN